MSRITFGKLLYTNNLFTLALRSFLTTRLAPPRTAVELSTQAAEMARAREREQQR